jgi:asparagine synthase (glutamine-hydrolysing)
VRPAAGPTRTRTDLHMCGIAGILDTRAATSAERLGSLATDMAATLGHRGPDDCGLWVDPECGVAFGHRRLAVIDPGPGGAQPMASRDGRWIMTYNGEIYNHRALRQQLEHESTELHGDSDTEVLLESVAHWGLENALDACEGMFAAALWDRRFRELHLVRDRFGEKPLYFALVADFFAFGSELKALAPLPGFEADVDRTAVAEYLRYNCIPAPRTIWRGVRKLRPGHLVTFPAGTRRGGIPPQRAYWSMSDAVATARCNRLAVSTGEMVERLEHVLSEAVGSRMVADVPVGAFLSGGIDSTTIVALMRDYASGPVRTFTVGFEDPKFDESTEALRVAQHLGTDHTAVHVDDSEAMRAIELLPDIWDEPFSDVSQIPTYLVSRVARQGVTVSLSGDGGDELFAGYNRHAWLERVWGTVGGLPSGVRRAAGSTLGHIPPGVVERAAGATNVLPLKWRFRNPSTKVAKLGRVLAAPTPEEAYRALRTHWADATSLVLGDEARDRPDPLEAVPFSDSGITERMLWYDLSGYLPDDILVKLDRAAMAVSLETRVPFLDRQVLQLAWSLPLDVKLREGQTKWLLRQVLQRHVPAELVERPKMGFGFPIGRWLRGPLREWAEHLLDERRLRSQGLLAPLPVRRAWEAHCAGKQDMGYELWDLLVLQSWIDRWRPSLR